jgi:hypothetical protein
MPNLAQVDAKQYGYRDDMPMTSKQVSIILGLSRKTVTNAMSSGKLKGICVGQEWRAKVKPYNRVEPVDDLGLWIVKAYKAVLHAKPSRKANG